MVKLDVEKEWLVRGLGIPLVELLPDLAVRGTDIVGHDIAQHVMNVEHLRQLYGAEIMEESGSLVESGRMGPCRPDEVTCMKCLGVEPESIHSTTEPVALMGTEEATIGKIGLPFLQRVDVFPLLGDAADFDHLLEKCVGDGNSTVDVCGLGGVLG